jgi:hypothetical protein
MVREVMSEGKADAYISNEDILSSSSLSSFSLS